MTELHGPVRDNSCNIWWDLRPEAEIASCLNWFPVSLQTTAGLNSKS